MNLPTNTGSFIEEHPTFTTDEFACMLREQEPDIARSTIYKRLNTLVEEGRIMRTGRGHFAGNANPEYRYGLSDSASAVAMAIQQQYPLIDYQIWELYQLNEFVNHQFARNTIFVDVEAMQSETIFRLLFEHYPHVLLNPTIDEYYRYMGQETIVVRELITESPQSYGEDHQASIEKILVDLFGKGLLADMVERAEYPGIYETAFAHYTIHTQRLFRYARRRGVERRIREFIANNTNIHLEE